MIEPTAHAPFESAFVLALPLGLVAGVHLPPTPDAVPVEVLARLHPDERDFAATLRGFRQVEYTGGRLALGALFGEMGLRRTPVLPDGHGAPALPAGVVASITHKRDLAVAILARGAPGLGLDLEETDRDRPGIAPRVLRPEELSAVQALAADRQWTETAVRFSVKEAIYKALHPFLVRYIGFHEVAVWPSPDGIDRVESFLPASDGPFRIEARHTWVGTRVLSMVRARRVDPAP